ncbi:MAG: hypothetical protein QOH31_1506 [Verrucomicrobiota bacterium]|jgi:hypothetical protein
MKRSRDYSFTDFLLELMLYGLFVALYLFLVFHFLGDWLKSIFIENRIVYAVVAVLLILTQAVGLERLTTGLLVLIRRLRK